MIHVLILLIVIGVILYLVNTYIPIAQPIKIVIHVIVLIAILSYVLRYFGIYG